MIHLFDLSYDILALLRAYVCLASTPDQFLRNDYLKVSGYDEASKEEVEWRNFVNTSKSLQELKRKTTVLVLSSEYFVSFMYQPPFRARIENLIEDRCKQLHFHINSYLFNDDEYYLWNNSQGISCYRIHETFDVSAFSNVLVLNLQKSAVIFICNLPNLQYLNVEECNKLTTISHLPSLQKLWVKGCKTLKTIRDLPTVYQVSIGNCTALTSLSNLPPITHLRIPRLLLARDFLASTKYHLGIDFENQHQIDQYVFSELGHLQSVEVIGFAASSFSFLSQYFSQIDFFSCIRSPQPVVISHLSKLHSLKLWDCTAPVIQFETLPALRYLALRECKELTEMHFVDDSKNRSGLIRVEISKCPDLKKIVIDRKIRCFIIQYQKSKCPIIKLGKPSLVQMLKVNDLQLLSETRNGGITVHESN